METLIYSNGIYTDQSVSDFPSESNSSSPIENFSPGTSLEDILNYQSDSEFLNYLPRRYPLYSTDNTNLPFYDVNNQSSQQHTLPPQSDILCDNINYNTMGQFPQYVEQRRSIFSPTCDKVDYNSEGDIFKELIMEQEQTAAAIQGSETPFQRQFAKEDNFLDSLGNLEEETNVDRNVDKQLNSPNVIHSNVDHIEELFPSYDFVNQMLEPCDLNDIDLLQDVLADDRAIQLEMQNYQAVAENNNSGSDIIPENLQQMVLEDEKNAEPQIYQRKIESCGKVPFKPRVAAGRKKIDWEAQKYIIDDDDEDSEEKEIDIVTVTKEDEPVIEATDVNSLLEQFELNQFRDKDSSKKREKRSSKEKLSGIKKDKSSNKLKKQKSKETITKHEKGRLTRLSEKMFENMKNSCLEKKSSQSVVPHKSEGKKLPKPESSKFNGKTIPSKPTQTHDSKVKKPEEQKQSAKKISNGQDKNANQPRSEGGKGNSGSPSEEKKVDVPKELIGRIKEGIKPRKVVLLDDPHLFGTLSYDKKKSSKPKVSTGKTPPSSTSDPSKKSVGTSTCSSTQTKPPVGGKSLKDSSVPTRSAGSQTAPTHTAPKPVINKRSTPPRVIPNAPTSAAVPSKPVNNDFSNYQRLTPPKLIPINKPATVTSAQPNPVNNNFSSFKRLTPPKLIPINKPSTVTSAQPKSINNSSLTSSNGSYSSTTIAKRSSPPRTIQNALSVHQQVERKIRQNIDLDHSYHRRSLFQNTSEKENSCSVTKNEPKVEQIENDDCNFKGANGKVLSNRLSDNEVKKKDPNKSVEESIKQENEKMNGEVGTSDKVAKKKWKFEDYIRHKGVPVKSNASPENRAGSSNNEDSHEEWAKKMGLVTGPRIPDNMVEICTFDIGVNACVADETAVDRLAVINPLLEQSNVKFTQNSFINGFKESVNNKVEEETDQPGANEYVHVNKTIRYVEKDRKMPEMRSMGVQTSLSLMESRPRKRSLSTSSSSSDDYSVDSRSSKNSRSRKRSRSPSKRFRSRSRSNSTLKLDNPNIELPRNFRSKEERDEFKQDAINRCILFLGDITEDMDERYLWRLFNRYGKIKRIKIYHRGAKRRRTSNGAQSQNFAFITFVHSSAAFDALNLYKVDNPDGPDFQMCFGGRREFCKEHYSDLDNMPSYFQYENQQFPGQPGETFDSLLEDLKQTLKKKKNGNPSSSSSSR